MAIRENANTMPEARRKEYVSAVIKFKKEGNPRSSRNYDTYVSWHQSTIFELQFLGRNKPYWSVSHGTPAFLPWHRIFLYLFEKDLQDVSGNKDLAIPYWDIAAKDASTSIWTNDFLGGTGNPDNDYIVESGPFAYDTGNWPIKVKNLSVEKDEKLRRGLGVGISQELPKVSDVRRVLGLEEYDLPPYDWRTEENSNTFRRQLEGRAVHGVGHNWVGGARTIDGVNQTIGSMANVWTSPNDPVFFLHHCNIDRLWDKWQKANPTKTYQPVEPIKNLPSASIDEASSFGFSLREFMNIDLIGYEYDNNASDDTAPEEEVALLSTEAARISDPGEYRNGRYPE